LLWYGDALASLSLSVFKDKHATDLFLKSTDTVHGKKEVKMWELDGLMDELVERVIIQIAADGDISPDELGHSSSDGELH
jgi:hypothetical protein